MGRLPGSKNKKQKKYSKKLLIAKLMPSLHHTLPGQKYDAKKSQVLSWIVEQPDILEWAFDQMKSTGYISYNSADGKWTGIDYDN